jgi:hypothetical protein
VRGDGEVVAAEQSPPEPPASEARASAPPPWGLLPSRIPPRIELLPGRSSIEQLRLSRTIAAWMFGAYVVVVALALLTQKETGAVALFAMVALLLAGTVLGIIGEPSTKRTKREHDAGYTVWRRGSLWKPQVDPESGFVIRPARAPELSRRQEAAELTRVREIARYLDDR